MDEKQMELAEAMSARANASGIAAAAKAAIPDKDLEPHEYLAEYCVNDECEEPLPELRKKKGLVLCTDCQSARERHKQRFGGHG